MEAAKPKLNLVVTGSVAAIKTGLLSKALKDRGFDVAYTVTPNGKSFLSSTKYPISANQLQEINFKTDTAGSEVTLVAPASAHYISLLANGDVKHEGQLMIAPAMNFMMWQHPAVQANVEKLIEKGARFLGPVEGGMACRDFGFGRFADPEEIAAAVSDTRHPLHQIIDQATLKKGNKAPNFIKPNPKKILLVSHTDEIDHDIVKLLEDRGCDVKCVTAKNRHYDSNTNPPGMEHIRFPEEADLVIMHNTTSEILEGMAKGRGGAFINDLYLASKAPTIVISKEPQPTLESYGTKIIEDKSQIEKLLDGQNKELSGKRFLIFGGAPRERVDSFRFYANNARDADHAEKVAQKLTSLGAEVTFICPAHSRTNYKGAITTIDGKSIESAGDMITAAKSLEGNYDGVIQLANVSQIRCPNPVGHKISKTSADAPNLFKTVGNIDVVATLSDLFPNTSLYGFNNYQQKVEIGTAIPDKVKNISEEYEPKTIKEDTTPDKSFAVKSASGRRVVITTSRTEEALTTDGVIITNSFSGKQGQSIARAFLEKGWEVVLISGPTDLPDVKGAKNIHVTSMKEMLEAAKKEIRTNTDAYISAAAIADFSVEKPLDIRLAMNEEHNLVMDENASVVGTINQAGKRPKVVVSFAAQSPETILDYATQKFKKLGVELTVANPIGADTPAAKNSNINRIFFISAKGVEGPIETTKDKVGELLVGRIEDIIQQKDLPRRP
jgi:phosphopantothenoylcysteine synthetase/decarboxylase